MLRIALDAMGGDDAPRVPVDAARDARAGDVDVVLVGDPDAIRAAGGGDLPVVVADGVVGMAEDPALAVRSKPRSSIRVAVGMVADGEAAALVSAGSTGATLAAALLGLGRTPGVRRPAVAAPLPTPAGDVWLLDAGASADARPEALVAYASLGAAAARARGVAAPRIGLLNVGSERGKGNELAREAFALLERVEGFAGNVEPSAVLRGAVDVVVTDGFTGNVLLKTIEAVRADGDSPSPGAAALLGVRGDVWVAHGGADVRQLCAALQTAAAVAAAGRAAQATPTAREGRE